MFDTLAYAKKLQEVGFTKAQAETLAEASRDFINENLATKTDIALVTRDIEEIRRDIQKVRAELKQDIEQLRAELKRDMAELKRDMAEQKVDLLKWIIGLLMVQTGIIAGIIIAVVRMLTP